MAKPPKAKLGADEIGTVAAMLETWNGPLTWQKATDRVALVLGRPFSRQALEAHDRIKHAYQTSRSRLGKIRDSVRAGKADPDLLPPELAVAVRRTDALQARIDRLQAMVDAYDAKFALWLYNARTAGVGEDRLNSPRPPVDRRADPDPGTTAKGARR
jgi:hypothetical protein